MKIMILIVTFSFLMIGCSLTKNQTTSTSLTKNNGLGPYYPPNPSGLPFYGSVPIAQPELATNDLTKHPLTGISAQGDKTFLSGTVIGVDKKPIPNVTVELWNTNRFGSYTTEKEPKGVDPGFYGYGKTKTDDSGRFQFTTIRPLAYTRYGFLIRRPAHFHLKFTSDHVIGIGIEADIINEKSQFVQGENQILLQPSSTQSYQWQGELTIVLDKPIKP